MLMFGNKIIERLCACITVFARDCKSERQKKKKRQTIKNMLWCKTEDSVFLIDDTKKVSFIPEQRKQRFIDCSLNCFLKFELN